MSNEHSKIIDETLKLPFLFLQEVIIEPVGVHLDIKRFTTTTKKRATTWDIIGDMDTIQIMLGQKDLSTIVAIYTDNIGEGKIIDLFPMSITSPTKNLHTDETVKNLEAFFCEPKQKDITVRMCFDGITIMFFFDSGELLSSPIRDLNHGLCKIEIIDIGASLVVYTDKSLEGKLAVDTLVIEEIGPDANAFDKGILQSPMDDTKNNNCHITVNKPPIIDISFHRNKTGDKSIDVIVGRLCLSLSVPFCEKLSLFVIECLPKENLESGIVNHGYVSDQTNEDEIIIYPKSITIAVRINRPEFVFIVETTSNKKRYFITKAEILSDYSKHCNRISFVLSLSGLHSLFYDIGLNNLEPYVILKQCDVELSKCSDDDKGEKIQLAVSSVNIQLCDRVFHSINDILNDITEHFKIPEAETPPREIVRKSRSKSFEFEDLWEPKKATEVVLKSEDEFDESKHPHVHEIFLLQKTEIVLIFELEETPVLIFKSTFEMSMYDWSSLLVCSADFTLQSNYFNENVQAWEPFVDPVVVDEYEYKPWEVSIKAFQDKSFPMLTQMENRLKKNEKLKKESGSHSSSNEDDDESGNEMIYLQPANAMHNRQNRRVKTSLSTFLDDSDSENEDGAMEKLAAAISDLFTG